MNIKQITGVYFSPTGNTKTAVELIAAQLSSQQFLLDLTGPGNVRIIIFWKTRQ